MGFAKFVGVGLGWTVGGPIGGMLGFAFGSLIDGFHDADAKQFEKEKAGFHKRIRDSYLALARKESQRFRIINSDQNINTIEKEIYLILDKLFL